MGQEDMIAPPSEHLSRFETNASITIPKDVFEKMYLTPQIPVKGELRRTFGNPTPLQVNKSRRNWVKIAESFVQRITGFSLINDSFRMRGHGLALFHNGRCSTVRLYPSCVVLCCYESIVD